MAVSILPSAEYLRECFLYDAETGNLIWLERPMSHFSLARMAKRANTMWAGKVAGYKRIQDGRTVIAVSLNTDLFLAHRIIWKMIIGEEPPLELDHEDRDPTNNKWYNLRVANRSQQSWNRKRHFDNKSGAKGVHWYPKTKKWVAQIQVHGKKIFLGYHPSIEGAHKAYVDAAKKYFGDYWSDGS